MISIACFEATSIPVCNFVDFNGDFLNYCAAFLIYLVLFFSTSLMAISQASQCRLLWMTLSTFSFIFHLKGSPKQRLASQ